MLKRLSVTAMLLLTLSLAGCATLLNPGGVKTIPNPPQGWSGRVLECGVFPMPRNARMWVNDTPIDLTKVDRGTSVFSDDAYGFKVFIPQDQPVTIRIQDGQRVGVARGQSKFYARWHWYNGFFGPAMPIGWLVDAKTKKWTYIHRNTLMAPQLLSAGRLELK